MDKDRFYLKINTLFINILIQISEILMMKTVKIYHLGKISKRLRNSSCVCVCVLGLLKTLAQKYIRTILRLR